MNNANYPMILEMTLQMNEMTLSQLTDLIIGSYSWEELRSNTFRIYSVLMAKDLSEFLYRNYWAEYSAS